jgi:hypothetical protein
MRFVQFMVAPVAFGLLFNTAMLLLVYRRALVPVKGSSSTESTVEGLIQNDSMSSAPHGSAQQGSGEPQPLAHNAALPSDSSLPVVRSQNRMLMLESGQYP